MIEMKQNRTTRVKVSTGMFWAEINPILWTYEATTFSSFGEVHICRWMGQWRVGQGSGHTSGIVEKTSSSTWFSTNEVRTLSLLYTPWFGVSVVTIKRKKRIILQFLEFAWHALHPSESTKLVQFRRMYEIFVSHSYAYSIVVPKPR